MFRVRSRAGDVPAVKEVQMRNTMTALFLALLLTSSVGCMAQHVRDDAVLRRLEGTWQGSGKIAVNWTKQREMFFLLTFARDGSVTGTAGDAVLRNGRLEYNDPISVWFKNPRYNIVADLEGPIIAAENIHRKSIGILVDFDGEELACDGNTSGWHIGGKDSMWMKIYLIRMKRVPAK
jgi:hypothetical protein